MRLLCSSTGVAPDSQARDAPHTAGTAQAAVPDKTVAAPASTTVGFSWTKPVVTETAAKDDAPKDDAPKDKDAADPTAVIIFQAPLLCVIIAQKIDSSFGPAR